MAAAADGENDRGAVVRAGQAGTWVFARRDHGGEHPERHLGSYAGLMQADAYAGSRRSGARQRAGYPPAPRSMQTGTLSAQWNVFVGPRVEPVGENRQV